MARVPAGGGAARQLREHPPPDRIGKRLERAIEGKRLTYAADFMGDHITLMRN